MSAIKSILSFLLSITLGFSSLAQSDSQSKLPLEYLSPIASLDSELEKTRTNSDFDRIHRYIKFDKIPSKKTIDKLIGQGINLLSYVGDITYLASINKNADVSQLSTFGVKGFLREEHIVRASEDVYFRALPEYAIEDGNAKLMIRYFRDLEQSSVIQKLEDSGVEVTKYNSENNFVEVLTELDKVEKLLEFSFVECIEAIPHPGVKDDRRGRSLHRVNQLNRNVAGVNSYTGQGIKVLVRDDGEVFDHIDFRGRIFQQSVGESRGSHGDGVGGIMAGAGNLNPTNQGMAFGSDMWVIDYDASFLDETMSLFFDEDVIVTNSSYSDGCNAGYRASTQIVDQQMYDNPTLLHVFSAGNNGQGLFVDEQFEECGYGAGPVWGNVTGGHKMGKNVITTANTNYRGEIMESSSRGPAHDGRIKPDIAANGNNHISTDEFQGYMSFGGTSGAAPVIAGVSAMLHQAYDDLYGERAEAALIKSVMLNTANDLGNPGPDFIYGWGSLNAMRAARTIEEGRFAKHEINQDETNSHVISVPENVAEMRVMVYWSDPESSIFTNWALINDLDIKLSDESNSQYLPLVLDFSPHPDSLSKSAVPGTDRRNNMEQVVIKFPEAGDYTLDVSGFQIPFGVHNYYLTYDFRMNEIDVIFPDGGENIDYNGSEVIHWDAEGDDGEFLLELVSSDGTVSEIATVDGSSRLYQWISSNQHDEFAKIRISRNDIVGESDDPFLIGDLPFLLRMDSFPIVTWRAADLAASYNVYYLGEKYMEKYMTTDSTWFSLEDHPELQHSWIAVSANFPEGTEGRRTVAITTTNAPTAAAMNSADNEPCINQPVTFESLSTDTLLDYNWQFGSSASPSEAFTEGPHIVVYTSLGTQLAALTISNDGGSDQAYFIMQVIEGPKDGEVSIDNQGSGQYEFDNDVKNADEYEWDLGDGTILNGKSVIHQYTASGNYSVSVKASSKCGFVTRTSNVVVDLTGVEELTQEDFIISPNPNNGFFEVSLPDMEGEDVTVAVLAIDGKLIEAESIEKVGKNQSITFDEYEAGVYLVKISFDNREITRKVVVR